MSGHSAGGLGGPANSAEPSGLPRGGVTRVRAKDPFQDVPRNSSPCPPLGCTWAPKPRVPGPDPLEQTWDLQASAGVGTSALLECTWDRRPSPAPCSPRPATAFTAAWPLSFGASLASPAWLSVPPSHLSSSSVFRFSPSVGPRRGRGACARCIRLSWKSPLMSAFVCSVGRPQHTSF